MKEYGFHIIAFVCIVSLFVTACDKTIHQYPESEKTWVMVELQYMILGKSNKGLNEKKS